MRFEKLGMKLGKRNEEGGIKKREKIQSGARRIAPLEWCTFTARAVRGQEGKVAALKD